MLLSVHVCSVVNPSYHFQLDFPCATGHPPSPHTMDTSGEKVIYPRRKNSYGHKGVSLDASPTCVTTIGIAYARDTGLRRSFMRPPRRHLFHSILLHLFIIISCFSVRSWHRRHVADFLRAWLLSWIRNIPFVHPPSVIFNIWTRIIEIVHLDLSAMARMQRVCRSCNTYWRIIHRFWLELLWNKRGENGLS